MARIGIIDADLLVKGRHHRFPNLCCMKISSWRKSLGDEVELVGDWVFAGNYDRLYVSKVFTDTPVDGSLQGLGNVTFGGTGFFFDNAQPLPHEAEHAMPDYGLYDGFFTDDISKRNFGRYFLDSSIGFLTRGCFRKCGFCVNRNSDRVVLASPLSEFYDETKGHIVLLDDNFLAHPEWERMLSELKETGKKTQFNQGLDARLLTKGKCESLFGLRYDGNVIFAFDDIGDYHAIDEKMKLVRTVTDSPSIMFYLLSGFDRSGTYDLDFFKNDIDGLFKRMELLATHRAKPYVMLHRDGKHSRFGLLYRLIANWANQMNLFGKMSFGCYVSEALGYRVKDAVKEDILKTIRAMGLERWLSWNPGDHYSYKRRNKPRTTAVRQKTAELRFD